MCPKAARREPFCFSESCWRLTETECQTKPGELPRSPSGMDARAMPESRHRTTAAGRFRVPADTQLIGRQPDRRAANTRNKKHAESRLQSRMPQPSTQVSTDTASVSRWQGAGKGQFLPE